MSDDDYVHRKPTLKSFRPPGAQWDDQSTQRAFPAVDPASMDPARMAYEIAQLRRALRLLTDAVEQLGVDVTSVRAELLSEPEK